MNHRPFRLSSFVLRLSVGTTLLLAGCEDLFTKSAPPRDFNELIPRMMGAMKGRTPEEAAINLFNVTSPDERRDAIAYLETKPYGHDAPYMRAYEVLTTDPHPMVRAQSMRALGTSRQPAETDYLLKGLNDENVQVRRDAAQGLVTTWNEKADPHLALRVKEDVDDQVRIFCAQALGHATTPEAIRALIDALSDKNAAVVRYAHSSLVSTTREDFGYDRSGWLSWYQKTYIAPPASAPAGRAPATNR